MTIARIEFPWGHQDIIKALSDEKYDVLRNIITDLPEDRTKDAWLGETLIDMDADAKVLSELGIAFTVKKIKGTIELNALTGARDDSITTVHIHVPNIGLLSIDEVCLMEDCCTNELQKELDAGWRILAVCPPNCQRRPDYIMGRVKPEGRNKRS